MKLIVSALNCQRHNSHTSLSMPGRRLRRGAALATLLMVVLLAVVIAFTLAGTSVFHLNVGSHANNAYKARSLAESVIYQGLERIIDDGGYGTLKDKTLTISRGEEMQGMLTFDPSKANELQLPHSTNNISKDVGTNGAGGRIVPKNSVHLVGKGTCNGVERTIEAIVQVPPYPYCIASSGKFSSTGELFVASVESAGDVAVTIDDNKLRPGHIASNKNNGEAIFLEGFGTIMGDIRIRKPGQLTIEPDPGKKILVLGEKNLNSDEVGVPEITLTDFDPAGSSGVQTLTTGEHNLGLSGAWRCAPGNSDKKLVLTGDLTLNDALLYIDGNLTVSGGVKGTGAIVTTGSTTISTGANLASENLVALLAGGNVNLGGAGSMDYSCFQGVVYTEGNFDADEIRCYGSFISNGSNSIETNVGNLSLNNTYMIHVPEYTEVSYTSGGGGTSNPFSVYALAQYIANQDPDWHMDVEREDVDIAIIDAATFEVEIVEGGEDERNILVHSVNPSNNQLEGHYGPYTEEEYIAGLPEIIKGRKVEGFINSGKQLLQWEDLLPHVEDYLQKALALARGETPQAGDGEETTTQTISLNQFINMEDRMKIILWKDM